MTVRELIEALADEDPNREVIMAKDGEGNSYSPLSSYWTGAYYADSTWSGKAGLEAITDEDREAGFDEADIVQGKPALILCPVS
jgi:hypothetical protein